VVDLFAAGAMALAVGAERGQLVVEQALAVVQQPPDQGALAIVHAAAGDEAQQRLGFVLLEIAGDVRHATALVGAGPARDASEVMTQERRGQGPLLQKPESTPSEIP